MLLVFVFPVEFICYSKSLTSILFNCYKEYVKVQFSSHIISFMSKISVPEETVVICQKPDKISDLTQQKRERTTEDFLNLISIYLLEFPTAMISYLEAWKIFTCNSIFCCLDDYNNWSSKWLWRKFLLQLLVLV